MKSYNNYARSFFRLLQHRLTNTRAPLFTALAVTNRCNFKCVYCYGDYYHQDKENFSTDELLKIIDTLRSMGTLIVNLIGGEPLLRTDIADLIGRVKRNKMICHVSTNASLIPEKIHALKNVDALDISLDGMRENNDKNRGQGTFEITLEGIRCALKNGLKTNVNMVLTRHNVSDVDDVVKLAGDLGFSLSFNLAFESHSASHINYRDSLAIKNEDDDVLKNTLKKIIAYKKKKYPIRFSAAAYTYALQWPVSYGGKVYITSREQLGAFKPLKCFFSRFHCYIDADGRMYNCMHLKDVIPEVNIREEPLGEAWKKVCAFKNECITCYTICNNDANLIFGLKPGVIFSTLRDFITKR